MFNARNVLRALISLCFFLFVRGKFNIQQAWNGEIYEPILIILMSTFSFIFFW
jgi:hypothetical protein